MMRKLTVLMLAALIGITVGCSKKEKEEAAGGEEVAAAKKTTIKISLVAKSSTNPVFLSARTGAEAAARTLSEEHGIDIVIDWRTPPTEDGQVQAQRISQAVNEGASAVLISCSDAGKVTGAINDAVDRGVPVMTFDSDAPDSNRFAFYGVDDIKTGELVMVELAKIMNEEGNVAILAGNQNAPNLRKRAEGVRIEAEKYPGIKIVGTFYHIESPQDAAAEVLRVNNAYPEINGWAMIGGWPLFTRALLDEIDPETMKIVAVDALPAQLPYVERGLAPVLLAQPTYMWGYRSVEIIIDRIYLDREVPEINEMQLIPVRAGNLGSWARMLKEWGFQDIPQEYLEMEDAEGEGVKIE